MKILIVTPSLPASGHGNGTTASRWARHLRALGHRVQIVTHWQDEPADFMIALHAYRSHDSIARWRDRHPKSPLVLVLTGTDIYRDLELHAQARLSLTLANQLVVLQAQALERIPAELQARCHVIEQSVSLKLRTRTAAVKRSFLVSVIGHLRAEKDPFCTAQALAHLPQRSRIRVAHFGAALQPAYAEQAQRWMQQQPRYHWHGARAHHITMRWLARSQLMVISSRMEGGAHVVSEAVALGVPILASRIAGNIGLLGPDYPGYFPTQDASALAALLLRAETEENFLLQLQTAVLQRRSLFDPMRERAALQSLTSLTALGMANA